MKNLLKVSWWTAEGKLDSFRLNVEKDENHNFFVEDIEHPYPMLPVLHVEWSSFLGVTLVTEKRPYFISSYDLWFLVFPNDDEEAIGLRMKGGILLAFVFDLVSKHEAEQASIKYIIEAVEKI